MADRKQRLAAQERVEREDFGPVALVHHDVRLERAARVERAVSEPRGPHETEVRLHAEDRLRSSAVAVLHANESSYADGRLWTRPFGDALLVQSAFDSALIAVGWAKVSVERALVELEAALAAQDADGRIPLSIHVPLPGEGKPAELVSKLASPPVQALALKRILEGATSAKTVVRAQALLPKLVASHKWWAQRRDPERSGLLTLVHPVESVWAASPRWDSVDPSDFRVKDVFLSALFVRSNQALAAMLAGARAPAATVNAVRRLLAMGTEGLLSRCEAKSGCAQDFDLARKRPVRSKSSACFAPLFVPALPAKLRAAQLKLFAKEAANGLVPSLSEKDPAFEADKPGQGAAHLSQNWLLWTALRQQGALDEAQALKVAGWEALRGQGFPEAVNSRTHAALGPKDTSLAAAVVLDWLHA